MSAAHSPISLEEYMDTSYSPDCEYVDGMVVERNGGKGKHSYTQSRLTRVIAELVEARGLIVLTAQRTRVSGPRVGTPDVCVVSELEEVTSKPPLLCVEVLSPDDRWGRVNGSVSDYQEMGVPCGWVIDPYSRRWLDFRPGATARRDCRRWHAASRSFGSADPPKRSAAPSSGVKSGNILAVGASNTRHATSGRTRQARKSGGESASGRT